MKNLLIKFTYAANKLQHIALLFLRLILAYGFWGPAKTKWADINSVAEWFGSMGIPAPAFNAYLAASTEMAGVFLLILGLGTRIISIPLIITMLVAIKTVHWQNGFSAGDNGYEIPLYYMLMLFVLLSFGAGKISVDYLIKRKTLA
ncbi:MAG: DoxX family protein [Bacteroidetes bacterium]|nr:DoxX family protein [Bacteroidota bacterium]